jgi:hypothetical protein
MRGRAVKHTDIIWLILLIVLFAATTPWVSWKGGIALTGASDVQVYEILARAAPSFPKEVVGSAYTDRYFVHWFIGTISAVSGLPLSWIYRATCALLLSILITVIWAVFKRLDVFGWPRRLCLALVILNPYALRIYAIVPGMIADLVFQTGLVLAMLGTISRRFVVLLTGVLVASLARQTILVAAPVIALWLLLDARRQPRPWPRRVTALTVMLLPIAVLFAVRQVTKSFTDPFSPNFPEDTIIPLIASLPTSASALSDHILRVSASLILAVSMLIVSLLIQRQQLGSLPLAALMSALVGASVICQPLGIGPSFPGFSGNEPRLSALGLIPMVVCLGVLLGSGRLRSWTTTKGLTLVMLVAAGSLHHIYTVIGPANVRQFIAVQVAAAVISTALLVVLGRSGSLQLTSTARQGRLGTQLDEPLDGNRASQLPNEQTTFLRETSR